MRKLLGAFATSLSTLVLVPFVVGSPAHGDDMPVDPASSARPNVVLVLLDDARLDDMGAMAEVTSRVADQGATFSNFYSSFPLCCPARATLLSGQYPHNHGVLNNVQPTGGWAEFDDSSTLATWLDPTYRTALVGKYFNQYAPPYQPPGWDEWMVPQGMYNYTGTRWWVDQGLGGSYRTLEGYQTDTIGALASDFITRNAPADEPFFLYTSIVGPHSGSPADPDDPVGVPTPYVKPVYRDAFEGTVNTDPSFNETDVRDKSVRPRILSATQVAGINEAMAQRREALLSAQDAITKVLDALQSTGELENTYVMVMSDNGYILGEHRIRGGKLAPYEVSNHVPFVVRGPGITPGTVIPDVSAQVDFAATVADIAGVAPGVTPDGQSLLPRMLGSSAYDPRTGVVIEATDTKATSDPLPWRYHGVVTPGWKYIERTNGKRELYDLASDPYELVNLAGQAAYAGKQQELAALNQRYQTCAGATCQ